MAIIAQIQGGLGNQLFQYAAAKAIAHHYQSDLLLDINWYQHHHEDVTPRQYQLENFRIFETANFSGETPSIPKRWRRLLQERLCVSPFIFVEKQHYFFDKKVFDLNLPSRQDLYLMGYWQSYKYFDDIRSLLQHELGLKFALDAHHQAYFEAITQSSSTMLHVRRGDYVSLHSASRVHNVVDLAYYHRAMKKALEYDPSAHFFIFSDDLEWAKGHLPYQERLTYIEPREGCDDVVQELSLMRACKSHILANSSLSWWGAWLKEHDGGFVIAPSRWVNDRNVTLDDLFPTNWLCL